MEKPILIVEDDADLALSLAQALEEEGYLTTVARNGQEALELLRAGFRPALILLDLLLPVMDGWELRREQLQQSEWASIPVLAMSTGARPGRKERPPSADGYLSKPMAISTLLKEVERLCGRPEERRPQIA